MRNSLKINYFFTLGIFWWIFFTFFRLVFIAYHFDKIPEGGFVETLCSLYKGFRLDISMIAYFLIVPFLIRLLYIFIKSKTLSRINNIFNYFLIIVVSLVSLSNIKIYQEWQSLLSYRAFSYLSHPSEILHFISFSETIFLVGSLLVSIAAGIALYKKLVKGFSDLSLSLWKEFLSTAGIAILLIVFSRGGFQQIPVNESNAYYSNIPVNNHIAVNPSWYFAHSFLEARSEQSPYNFLNPQEAGIITKRLFSEKEDSTVKILKTNKPNIVFIVLESWTADILSAFGDTENITPNVNELVKQGLLFSNAYASGSRTEQGLISIFSGFPAQPNNSIITDPAKAEKLPSFIKTLRAQNYKTSFYYGGEAAFANMKTYLLSSGIENITDKNSFNKNQMNSKWGAHDGFVLEKNLEGLKNSSEPFLSIVLTLSTHEPFEVPMETPFKLKDEPSQFKKAAYYTDHCIGEYFKKAKKEKWYSNTLFVLVADHGHRLPLERDLNTSAAKHITLLFLGGALKDEFKGKLIDKIVGQHDLSSTLLSQLDLDHKAFSWSRNIFSQSKPFAYYANENVLGWISPEYRFSFNFTTKEIKEESGKIVPDSIISVSKAYLQELYRQYLIY